MMAGRGASAALLGGLRLFSTAPATTAAPAKGGGFLASLFGGAPRIGVPLTEALQGVPAIAPKAAASADPKTEITTMKNGVNIATEATHSPTTSIGLYVDAGSVSEHPGISGVSHLLEHLAFSTTTNRSTFRIVREVEAIGASVTASASREQIAYAIDGVRTNIPEMLEVLVDSVVNPVFEPWEVQAKLKLIEAEIKQLSENPQGLLLEAVNEAAYAGGLAQPLVCPTSQLKALTPDSCREFVSANYVAPKVCLSVAGAEHSEVVPVAEQLLSALPAVAPDAVTLGSQYLGGEVRHKSAGDMAHMILCFEYKGGWRDLKGSVVVTVLQMLLGGGGSFSAGGPGKGMHSRLYTRVLNSCPWVANCTAYSNIYNETGLVGVFASCEGARADEMVGILCNELESVAKGDVSDVELQRAKNAALASVWMNLESNAIVSEDIGRQVLFYGKHISAADFIADIDSVTKEDIASCVTALLKTPPTLASAGELTMMPRVDAVARRFAP